MDPAEAAVLCSRLWDKPIFGGRVSVPWVSVCIPSVADRREMLGIDISSEGQMMRAGLALAVLLVLEEELLIVLLPLADALAEGMLLAMVMDEVGGMRRFWV